MILLDTHCWIWLVDENGDFLKKYRKIIEENDGICISAISCWEVAKLVEYGRLKLNCPIDVWIEDALIYSDIELINLTPEIAIESTQLPGDFHRDPADQIIVASSRILDVPLLTMDRKILEYPFVKTI
ncbi:MAG: type II toxin-antitoxin system VapC family toxin [Candidatus Cloacimonetes bacterium]|nr:type II toxin-antitoxin system VapC family toxin [Candidatus Cloacimonadota bacterium]